MSFGSTAYASYVQIRSESEEKRFPSWTALPHIRRLAWEAAAQAVALAVLPSALTDDLAEFDDYFDDDEIVGFDTNDKRIDNEELDGED